MVDYVTPETNSISSPHLLVFNGFLFRLLTYCIGCQFLFFGRKKKERKKIHFNIRYISFSKCFGIKRHWFPISEFWCVFQNGQHCTYQLAIMAIFFLTKNSTFVHHSIAYSNWTHFAAHHEKWKWRVTSKAFIHHFIFLSISSFRHSQDHLLYEPVVTSLLTNRHNWPNTTTAPKVRRLWPLFLQSAVNF